VTSTRQPARLFDLDAPDPVAVAARILERCAAARGDAARWEARDPVFARALRRDHARCGTVPPFDDPTVSVRCSELEALAAPGEAP
jgi:hypothetical protein